MEPKIYQYWLCQAEGFGAVKVRLLLEMMGDAKTVFQASALELGQAIGEANYFCKEQGTHAPFSEKDLGNLLNHQAKMEDCIHNYEVMKASGIHFITPEDPEYPSALWCLYDNPQGLFLKGTLPDPQARSVSIVGARRCTAYGSGIAYNLGKELVLRGTNVISGMAEGIDGAAHRGAIDGIYETYKQGSLIIPGMTLAFLGGGVDVCYPKCNMDVYKELAGENGNQEFSCGGLISEHGIGVMPFPGQFPMRNRLISAMSDMLIVCEARVKSGSLITADQALEQGKEVFVVPGRITDPLSAGCNRLIAQGAGIITNLEEFLNEHFQKSISDDRSAEKIKNNLAMNEEMVYSGLDFIPMHINQILKNTGLELSVLLHSLQNLQKAGLIFESAKNYYVRKL